MVVDGFINLQGSLLLSNKTPFIKSLEVVELSQPPFIAIVLSRKIDLLMLKNDLLMLIFMDQVQAINRKKLWVYFVVMQL